MFKGNLSSDGRKGSAARVIGRFRRCIKDVTEPGNGEAGLMEVLPNLCKSKHRRTHPPSEHVEGHKLPDCEAAINDQFGSHIERSCGDQLADQLNSLTGAITEAQNAKARGNITSELFFPA